MDVRVATEEIAEGLTEQDQSRARARAGARIRLGEQAFDDSTQLPEELAGVNA